MNTHTLIVVLLIVLLIAALPIWPYTAGLGMGYGLSGVLGLVVVVLLILVLTGRI